MIQASIIDENICKYDEEKNKCISNDKLKNDMENNINKIVDNYSYYTFLYLSANIFISILIVCIISRIIHSRRPINDYSRFLKYSILLCFVIGIFSGYALDDYLWNTDNYNKFNDKLCDSRDTLLKISRPPEEGGGQT